MLSSHMLIRKEMDSTSCVTNAYDHCIDNGSIVTAYHRKSLFFLICFKFYCTACNNIVRFTSTNYISFSIHTIQCLRTESFELQLALSSNRVSFVFCLCVTEVDRFMTNIYNIFDLILTAHKTPHAQMS